MAQKETFQSHIHYEAYGVQIFVHEDNYERLLSMINCAFRFLDKKISSSILCWNQTKPVFIFRRTKKELRL